METRATDAPKQTLGGKKTQQFALTRFRKDKKKHLCHMVKGLQTFLKFVLCPFRSQVVGFWQAFHTLDRKQSDQLSLFLFFSVPPRCP